MMRLIKIAISGHPLFEDGTEFSTATVSALDKSTESRAIPLHSKLAINRVIGVSGLNAVGKTTLLNLFTALHSFYVLGKGVNESGLADLLRTEMPVTVSGSLFDDETNKSYQVETTLARAATDVDDEWRIGDEKVYSKELTRSTTRKSVFDFTASNLLIDRSTVSEADTLFLHEDESVFRGIKTNGKVPLMSTREITNVNRGMTFSDQTPIELIQYLDDSIEYFEHINDPEDPHRVVGYKFKFKNEARVITASDMQEVSRYLSSGTVRGITLFYMFLRALRLGATLIVDEIELHVNKKIVRDFIAFFSDESINTENASLIYTTHYIELLDDLQRKDELYLVVRREKAQVVRVSSLKNARAELKKSEQFLTNSYRTDDNQRLLTAPSAKKLSELRKAIKEHVPLQDFKNHVIITGSAEDHHAL
jgi:ABC-type uncharacterized transport system ATPase subunit